MNRTRKEVQAETMCFVQELTVVDDQIIGLGAYQGISPCDIGADHERGVITFRVYKTGEPETGMEISVPKKGIEDVLMGMVKAECSL